MRASSISILLVSLAASLAGSALASQKRDERPSILILAAASTTDALEDITRQFEQAHPTVDVRTSFGASSTLAQQIASGGGPISSSRRAPSGQTSSTKRTSWPSVRICSAIGSS